MVTKLILNSKINSERRKRIKLEYERESLIKQLMVLEKFNNQIINLSQTMINTVNQDTDLITEQKKQLDNKSTRMKLLVK